jgi:hypothetical protein
MDTLRLVLGITSQDYPGITGDNFYRVGETKRTIIPASPSLAPCKFTINR